MARFKQTFRVKAALAATWGLHDDPQALHDLTPPPLRVKILAIDKPLVKGSQLSFRLVLWGPLGATWNAIYDEFDPYQPGMTRCGFVDRALRSPFRAWTHRHTFEALPDGTSTVTDEATFQLFGGPLLTWLMGWPAVAFLFMYRRWRTQRILIRARARHNAPSAAVAPRGDSTAI